MVASIDAPRELLANCVAGQGYNELCPECVPEGMAGTIRSRWQKPFTGAADRSREEEEFPCFSRPVLHLSGWFAICNPSPETPLGQPYYFSDLFAMLSFGWISRDYFNMIGLEGTWRPIFSSHHQQRTTPM
jgi:hypothetical protein